MKYKKKTMWGFIVVVLAVCLFFLIDWFGVFKAAEFYKGLDWNTTKWKVEWRLKKDHYWHNEKRYISTVYYPKEYRDTWAQEDFYFDEKSERLKKIRLFYATTDSDTMSQVYESQKKRISKKLGKGSEYEGDNFQYTEWREEKTVIRVIKNDYENDDANDIVQVIYLNKDYSEPFFTKMHLDENTFKMMLNKFFCDSSPVFDERSGDMDIGYDFSQYKLVSTKETSKVVALLNKKLFASNSDVESRAKRIVLSKGIAEDHPLTVDWVMDHPAKSVAILTELTREDDFLKSRSDIDKAYEYLTDEEKRKS